VKDERSFNFKNFEVVLAMHQSGEITINYEEKTQLMKILERLKVLSSELNSKKINYDDACDEYLDSITFQLMDDPVMLPSSKTIVDRKTIETHLTKDKTDPFNRSLLTSEMLISCSELKNRIEEYKKGKKIY
jgi:ubiquitin conjugation factor E4 B